MNDSTIDNIAEETGVQLEACGLNADWSVSAFCLDGYPANTTDGAYYITDSEEVIDVEVDENGEEIPIYGAFLVRRFYQEALQDDYIANNPYDDRRYDGDEFNDDIVEIASSTWTPEGFKALIEAFKNDVGRADAIHPVLDKCLSNLRQAIRQLNGDASLEAAYKLIAGVKEGL